MRWGMGITRWLLGFCIAGVCAGADPTPEDFYRVGDHWNREKMTLALPASDPLRRLAKATAKVRHATAIFLGRFQGRLVMATNHHVLPTAAHCLGRRVSFPLLGLELRCSGFVGTWEDIDLSLFVVGPASSALLAVASNFAFSAHPRVGEKLATLGFGIAGDPAGTLSVDRSDDCQVLSATGEARFLEDPDQLLPTGHKTWSFATGCDVSHGDSGSALLSRESGRVVGLLWTGKVPKDSSAQDSKNLSDWARSRDPRVWTELTYAVPAWKMREHLLKAVAGSSLSPTARRIVKDLIASP